MSAALRETLQQARHELASNARLRAGVCAIAALIWVYGLLVLRDLNRESRADWSRTEARISRAKNTALSGEWNNRALDVKASVNELEQLLWREGSIGLAQAAAQEAVARSLVSAGISQRSLRSATADSATFGEGTANISAATPIRIRAQFEFKASTFYPWLHAISRSVHEKKPALVIDSLVIRGAPNSIVDVELVAYSARPESVVERSSTGGEPAIAKGAK